MTARQFACLFRDQWRNTYALFCLAGAVCLASCLGTFAFSLRAGVLTRSDHDMLANMAVGGMHAGQLLWIVLLLFASADNKAIGLSMPRYVMRLPVSSWGVVAARMAYGLFSVSALALMATCLYYTLFDAQMTRALPLRTFILIYPAVYSALQAAAWTFGPFGIVPAVVFTFLCSLLPNGVLFAFKFAPLDQGHYSIRGVLATIAASYAIAGIAVTEHRKRRYTSADLFVPIWSLSLHRLRREPPSFASKEEALRWYEFRRQLHLFPALLLCFFVALCILHYLWFPSIASFASNTGVPIRYVIANYADRIQYAFYYALIGATLLCSGLFFFQTQRTALNKNNMFLQIRPVTVRTLATSRLQARASAIARGVMPLLLLVTATLFFDLQPGPFNPLTGHPEYNSTIGHLTSQHSIAMAALACAVTFLGLCAAVWACVWLENILVLGGVFAVIALAIELAPAFHNVSALARSNYAFYGTSVVACLLTAILFAQAIRKRVVNVSLLFAMLPLLPIFGTGLFLFLCKESVLENKPIDYSPLTTIAPLLMLATIAPLGMTPLLAQWSRHRK